jgi:aerobic carbon-monoxide dehydrogenase small subunit
MSEMMVDFKLNGAPTQIRVMGPISLLDVLRDQIGLAGSKSACAQGECGSCSVILDGDVVCSCLVMAADAAGSVVVTVEGLSGDGAGPVEEAMLRAGAVQCGFCTPGIVVAAIDLFGREPRPTTTEIKEALAGNICRCTGYGAILRALESLAMEEQM